MKKNVFFRVLALFFATFICLASFAQKKISGTVIDDKGSPLPGATVTAQGQRINTTTNANGVFNLTVPDNAKILEITYIGMVSQEIPVPASGSVIISLK